uniref:Uncharacterized protein n=1 Tax=Arundo donax TaxID=35708 RepID=A0A0A9DQ32_ARUDO
MPLGKRTVEISRLHRHVFLLFFYCSSIFLHCCCHCQTHTKLQALQQRYKTLGDSKDVDCSCKPGVRVEFTARCLATLQGQKDILVSSCSLLPLPASLREKGIIISNRVPGSCPDNYCFPAHFDAWILVLLPHLVVYSEGINRVPCFGKILWLGTTKIQCSCFSNTTCNCSCLFRR